MNGVFCFNNRSSQVQTKHRRLNGINGSQHSLCWTFSQRLFTECLLIVACTRIFHLYIDINRDYYISAVINVIRLLYLNEIVETLRNLVIYLPRCNRASFNALFNRCARKYGHTFYQNAMKQ